MVQPLDDRLVKSVASASNFSRRGNVRTARAARTRSKMSGTSKTAKRLQPGLQRSRCAAADRVFGRTGLDPEARRQAGQVRQYRHAGDALARHEQRVRAADQGLQQLELPSQTQGPAGSDAPVVVVLQRCAGEAAKALARIALLTVGIAAFALRRLGPRR